MTYEEWFDIYRPIKNHLNGNASFDGHMFETFGPELDFVRSCRESTIWTYVTGDADVITDGYHHVNRMGYFITEVPHALDESVEIDLDEDDDEDL